MARMAHPNIVRIKRMAFEEDGYVAYVMEYVAGRDLYKRARSHPPEPDTVIGWFIQLSGALAHAHALGVVHRDISPANVLLDDHGVPKLTDFDLMKGDDTTGGTMGSAALGTYLFAAPESLRDAGSVDARSDIYSLGMTLLFCMRRRRLDDEVITNPENCLRQLKWGEDMRDIVRRAIARDVGKRTASAAVLLRELHAVLYPVDVEEIAFGTIIADRYRVVTRLHRGKMSTIYLAEHSTVMRREAIKVLTHQWSRSELVAKRFRAAARAASASGHPNIVEVFDAGELPDGRLWYAMEYLTSRNLQDEIKEFGTLPVGRACRLVRAVTRAVVAAHDVGIIHRRLKPGHVMLVPLPEGEGETVKVIDFGSSSGAERTEAEARITVPGYAIGHLRYMPPEQTKGKDATELFDVYALGVILYECLVGETPFVGKNPVEIVARKCTEQAPSLGIRRSDLPLALVQLVDACLEIDPSDRPQSAREFLQRLDEAIKVLPADPPERTTRAPRTATQSGIPVPDAGEVARTAYYRTVYNEYVECLVANDEPVETTFEKFAAKLRAGTAEILEKRPGARDVKFVVYTKDGKAAVKARVVGSRDA